METEGQYDYLILATDKAAINLDPAFLKKYAEIADEANAVAAKQEELLKKTIEERKQANAAADIKWKKIIKNIMLNRPEVNEELIEEIVKKEIYRTPGEHYNARESLDVDNLHIIKAPENMVAAEAA